MQLVSCYKFCVEWLVAGAYALSLVIIFASNHNGVHGFVGFLSDDVGGHRNLETGDDVAR